jgi:hypothetical protein
VVIAAAVVTMLVVFAIAAGAVGREAQRLDAVPARPVFDPDEATTWIAERLAPQVTAVLSYADLGEIVNWTLEVLREHAAVARRSDEVPDAGHDVVLDTAAAVAHVRSQATASGLTLDDGDAWAAVEATLQYLDTIGAIGPVAEENG